jgi:hypothetical protein
MRKNNKRRLIKSIKNTITFIFIAVCFIIVASFDTVPADNTNMIKQAQNQRQINIESQRGL